MFCRVQIGHLFSLFYFLDLLVTDPDGVVYYGNNVQGDRLNNNERVSITNPKLGEYFVEIVARDLSFGACPDGTPGTCQLISIVSTSSGSTIRSKSRLYGRNSENKLGIDVGIGFGVITVTFFIVSWLFYMKWAVDNKRYVRKIYVEAGQISEDLPAIEKRR